MAKIQTSIRLSQEAKRLICKLASKLGLNQSAILELAIREMAERKNIS